jgi:hypothetical protein
MIIFSLQYLSGFASRITRPGKKKVRANGPLLWRAAEDKKHDKSPAYRLWQIKKRIAKPSPTF